MNRPEAPKAAVPIDLSREPDLVLGGVQVRPSLREVRAGERQEAVEPRVMQVLVALARAAGAVVSRDSLIESCWGGRIVGDDAVNRCIGKARQIADLAGARAFEIETIPRVGYRLRPLGPPPAAPSPAIEPPTASAPETARPAKLPWKWISAGLGALLIASGAIVLGLSIYRPKPSAHWEVAQSQMLIATSLIERHPAISPDGTMIAYSAGTDILSRKIYLRRISGGDALRLTDDAYDDVSPTWSPDGTQIVYVAFKDGEPCRLMVTPVPAGSPRELGRCQSDERSHVVWSPSGRELFFLDAADTKSVDRVMRFDLASGRRSELTNPPADSAGDEEPAVSPDGHWLTFMRYRNPTDAQRFVVDLHTGAMHTLVYDDSGYGAAWSEDSRTIFGASGNRGDFALWADPVDGSMPSRILSSPEEMGRLASGPHGLLAVEINTLNIGLARSPATSEGDPVFLDREKGYEGSPDIAPDGTVVAAILRPGGFGIWLMPKGGPLRKLIDLNGVDWAGEPRWSPDGSRIAFETKGNTDVIRVITASGYDVATIAFHGNALAAPAWTAGGRTLIFPGHDARGWHLCRVDLAHPDRVSLMPYDGWLSVRTRGDALYGVRYDAPGVWRIDGISRRITPKPASERANEWNIVGNEIAYLDDPFGKKRQIIAQPIDGGPSRVLAQVPRYAWAEGFAVDPADGSVSYAATLDNDTDIELLHLVQR